MSELEPTNVKEQNPTVRRSISQATFGLIFQEKTGWPSVR